MRLLVLPMAMAAMAQTEVFPTGVVTNELSVNLSVVLNNTRQRPTGINVDNSVKGYAVKYWEIGNEI
ncbi:MAG: hypothetical protein AAB466_06065 [Verrucomicrobiota bacterium]